MNFVVAIFVDLLLRSSLVSSFLLSPPPAIRARGGDGSNSSSGITSVSPLSLPLSSSTSSDESSEAPTAPSTSITTVYLDVTIPADTKPHRLVFHLPTPGHLPLHTSNLIKLFAQSSTSLDPRCTYVGCAFRHSPTFVEGYPQYRWAHTLDGKGINAVGRGQDRIEEKVEMATCRVDVGGSGSYYGIAYEDIPRLARDNNIDNETAEYENEDFNVALTVPLSGPGRGGTSFSIVRVEDSPSEWGERLLINCAVVGWLDPSCGEALRAMATQVNGPPMVVASGLVESEEGG